MKGSLVNVLFAGFLIVACSPTMSAQSDTQVDARKATVVGQLLDATHAADQVLTAIETQLPAMRAA